MPPSAFTSPAVTAASRCCSASVRRTRFAASLRPGGRPSGFLSDSLPPSGAAAAADSASFSLFCFFFRAGSFSCSFSSCKKRAESGKLCQPDSAKKRAKGAPVAAPDGCQGTGWVPGGTRIPSCSQNGAGGCQRQRTRPKGAYAEHSRARRELKASVTQCMAFRCAYVKYLASYFCGA